MTQQLTTIAEIVQGNLDQPQFVFRPAALQRAATYFMQHFNAKILYAVKTNPDFQVIHLLYQQGLRCFDIASLQEIRAIRRVIPEAELYFMHPVKPRRAIWEAYHIYGVRHFALDSEAELEKILQETQRAKDLCLHLRLSIPNTYAELHLSEKFGISLCEATPLLLRLRQHAAHVGVCFHVGSQCMHPDAYRIAIRMTAEVLEQTDIKIESFDVGGGFPSIYPGMIPPPLTEYFSAIHEEFSQIKNHQQIELLCEPGRALVAESTSVIVRVDLRKGNHLYINDGTYGSLFDAGTPRFIFPVQLLSDVDSESSDLLPFSLYGPTCDSLDFMKGPFYLPKDVGEGDYIEVGQVGAYARALATHFNGFGHAKDVAMISDEPLMTMYDASHISNEPLEVIAA